MLFSDESKPHEFPFVQLNTIFETVHCIGNACNSQGVCTQN
jgi:hypothetical protein